jgi:hypothetical protein
MQISNKNSTKQAELGTMLEMHVIAEKIIKFRFMAHKKQFIIIE